jgi:hypothetical protein
MDCALSVDDGMTVWVRTRQLPSVAA